MQQKSELSMTSYGPTFPEATDDGCEPFRVIGKYLGFSELDVLDAFEGLCPPEWSTPEVKDNQKASTLALNRCASSISKSMEAFSALSEEDYRLVVQAGCITLPQLRATHAILLSDSDSMSAWYKQGHRRGGRNIAAYTVSEGIRRLFRRKRLAIGWGVSDAGLPSTPFGRAVEFAMGEFGIVSDWRGPTKAAWEKQKKIEARFMAIRLYHHSTPK